MLLLLYLFCLYICYSYGMGAPPGAEDVEFVLNFESPVYVCSDDDSKGYIDTSAIEMIRINETTSVLNGAVAFHKGFDHSTMAEIIVEKEASGRYEMVTSHEVCDVCAEVGIQDSPYYKYLKYIGFPDQCPFDAGSYNIDNLIADLSDLPINSANAGKYLVTVYLYKDGDGSCKNDKTLMACVKLDAVIEPL